MIESSHQHRWQQRGVTSVFAVIFAATILSIIVVSFAAIMMREQGRSTDGELSQSAYDSAMAGVEDAKRVIGLSLTRSDVAETITNNSSNCSVVAMAATAGGINVGSVGQETIVQSTSGASGTGSELLQAYTCVKINLDSPDVVLHDVRQFESRIVPLRGAATFDRVRVEWHMTNGTNISTPCGAGLGSLSTNLCLQSSWRDTDISRPGILRAQVVSPGSSYSLSDLDRSDAGNTLFLYPTVFTSSSTPSFNLSSMARYVAGNGESSGSAHRVERVQCSQGSIAGYHCAADIVLPSSVPAGSNNAILRVGTLYKTTPTSIRVTLRNGSNQVNFSRVQPTVDSTGRANDLFRRVEARISLSSDVQYPEFAVDLSGPFCKDFHVRPDGVGQIGGAATCNP